MHSPESSHRARCPAILGPVTVLPVTMLPVAMLPVVMLVTLLLSACAHSPLVDSAAAPRGDPLALFVRTSPAALTVADAARVQGLLSDAEPEVGELELASRTLGIEDLGELESRLEAVLGEVPALFAALDRRDAASKRGDVAHWVAVALVGLDDGPVREGLLQADNGWEREYLDTVLELRRLHEEGGLAAAAGGAAGEAAGEAGGEAGEEGEESTGDATGGGVGARPVPSDLVLALSYGPERRPEFVADRDVSSWPVFPSPGARRVVAIVPLERGRGLHWDELRVRVRRAGEVRALEALEGVPRFRLDDRGRLVPDGEVTLERGRRLDLLVDLPAAGGYALLEPGRVVELPRGCCPVVERAETDWWVRLAEGEGQEGWVMVSSSAFRMRHPGLEERMRERREASRARRLGELDATGTLEVAGAELIYWIAGNDDAPPLFVLHGGPGLGSHYLQNPLLRTLGEERRLVFYDQRGSGYSEGAEEPIRLTLQRFVFDLEAVRRAARQERIDLLGHSFGGLLALRYALEYPERVGKLVLVDPDPASRALWQAFEERIAGRTSPPDAARLAEIASRPGWERDPEVMAEWLKTRLRAYVARPQDAEEIVIRFDEMTLRNFRVTRDSVRRDLGDWDLHDRLGVVMSPTLILAGGDSIFPPAAMEALEAALPDAELQVLEGVGHFPFVEVPESFAGAVLAFLEGR